MEIRGIMDTNFQDFKEISFYIAFPFCSFKCERDCGKFCCANRDLVNFSTITISPEELVDRYGRSALSRAVVCGGLEPLDSIDDLLEFIEAFRKRYSDPVIIYTGYREDEVADKIERLKEYPNLIVKFGRFRPDEEPHYDEVLGIKLASDNQYAKKIS